MICAKTILSGHSCNSDPGTPTPQETIPALRGGKDVSARPRMLREEDRHVAHMAGTGLCLELVLYEPPEAAVAGVADEDDVARPCGLQLHELHGLLELLDLAVRVRVGPGNPRRLWHPRGTTPQTTQRGGVPRSVGLAPGISPQHSARACPRSQPRSTMRRSHPLL